MEASFVADAIHLLEDEQMCKVLLHRELDDEASVLSFSLADGSSFSVLGASYPAETVVLGGAIEQLTLRNVALRDIVQSLLQPEKETTRLERDLQELRKCKFGQLSEVKFVEGGLSFKLHGKRYSVNASAAEYPRNTVVTANNELSCVDVPLPLYLEKLDAKQAPAKKHRHSESSGSEGNDDDDDDDDDDEDDEDDDGGDDDGGVPLQSSGENCCSEDLAHFSVVSHCGPLQRDKDAVAMYVVDDDVFVINQVDDQVNLGLHLSVTHLSARVATAWGIVPELPVRVALRDLSASMYCNSAPPSVQICQMIDGLAERHGVLPQLEFIAQSFIKEEWNKFKARGCVYYQDAQLQSPVKPGAPPPSGHLATLIAMGFPRRKAEDALKQSKDNLEDAIAVLTKDKKGLFGGKDKKRPTLAVATGAQSITKSVEEAEKKKNAFQLDPEKGLLVGLLEYLTYRLQFLNEVCPLCDGGHFFGAPMLKPAVCRRELCAFAFSKLGLMSDTVDGVAMQAEVVDLLVSMCRAAAGSTRANMVLDPCPLIYDPKDPEKPVISDVTKDLTLINAALAGIKMSTMMEVARGKATDVHPLSYPMLQWVVSSNRSHLVKLSPEKHLACMGTKYQFLLLSAPPEIEEAFLQRKKEKGTVWAFHGSRTENWHAILRNGVKNMSGTKGQLNGAAYGPGVYVSPTAQMSLGYSGMHGKAPNAAGKALEEREFLEGEFFCMAIMEIIAGAEKRHNASIWTVVDDTQIVSRFFMVWPPGSSTATAAQAVSTSDEFLKQVNNAMSGLD